MSAQKTHVLILPSGRRISFAGPVPRKGDGVHVGLVNFVVESVHWHAPPIHNDLDASVYLEKA